MLIYIYIYMYIYIMFILVLFLVCEGGYKADTSVELLLKGEGGVSVSAIVMI